MQGDTKINPTEGDRLKRLSEACLRINESMDLETVLQEVLDSARALTEARYGAFILLDGERGIADFLSSGLSPEEADRMWSEPDARGVFGCLDWTEGPLRVPDLLGYIREQGLPELPSPVSVGAFLGAPVLRQGERVGNIFVAKEKGGGEFVREDEDALVMFASQSALVIANSRRHLEEQRARARLETLIDTSPIGMVAFDAGTGEVTSLNREAVRIVESLLNPDQPVEKLPETLTVRRADGREMSLQELPLAQAFSEAETVRAEEVVIAVPDGRSVATLVNVTPIRTDEGEVESVVVTMQDLSHLREPERLRAEFLAMVSHELRLPLTSIRGSATTLIDEGPGLDPAEMRQFSRIIVDQADHMRSMISDLLDVARIETGTLSLSPEPSDVAALVDQARNSFERGGGRSHLDIAVELDLPQIMADRRRIVQVLGNLLSNADRHSGEGSSIGMDARRQGAHVAVSVSDSGQGIPAEVLPLLFRKFSRVDSAGPRLDQARSGLGLTICKGIVEAHGGRILADSDGPGKGARFTFTIPIAVPTSLEIGGPVSRRTARHLTRVLAVDDDPEALRQIRDALARTGYYPVVTGDPADLPRLMVEERPHLVLLDLVLPNGDGIDLMRQILASSDVPVIFVSAYGQEELVIKALDAGAVDYVVKPFSPSELSARIRSAMRQRAGLGRTGQPKPYLLGELNIDYAERRVTLAGRQVDLTATEYGVLHELSAHAGTVLTHDQLLLRVWGMDHSGDHGLVRTIVTRLRGKLGDRARQPRYILTEPRVGYRMPKGEAVDEKRGNLNN